MQTGTSESSYWPSCGKYKYGWGNFHRCPDRKETIWRLPGYSLQMEWATLADGFNEVRETG